MVLPAKSNSFLWGRAWFGVDMAGLARNRGNKGFLILGGLWQVGVADLCLKYEV